MKIQQRHNDLSVSIRSFLSIFFLLRRSKVRLDQTFTSNSHFWGLQCRNLMMQPSQFLFRKETMKQHFGGDSHFNGIAMRNENWELQWEDKFQISWSSFPFLKQPSNHQWVNLNQVWITNCVVSFQSWQHWGFCLWQRLLPS